MWWKRWEPILEQKPVPAEDVLLELLAKELCDLVESFPPAEADVEWQDDRTRARYAGRLAALPPPDLDTVDLLAKILVHDLRHEQDAIDFLFRNDHHRAACPTPEHVDALHLLWQVALDQLLYRQEQLRTPLPRRTLVRVVERFRERFRVRKQHLLS